MNFKKFLATAALAIATVVVPSAEAFTDGQRNLDAALTQAGVTTTLGECESATAYGYFIPAQNHIHICDNVATTEQLVMQTWKHEAVHAAQRCVNPSMAFTVTTSRFLLDNGSQSDWNFIQEAYDREDWAIELEAFTLMRYEAQVIADIVNDACN